MLSALVYCLLHGSNAKQESLTNFILLRNRSTSTIDRHYAAARAPLEQSLRHWRLGAIPSPFSLPCPKPLKPSLAYWLVDDAKPSRITR
jgi:hypothetical protein